MEEFFTFDYVSIDDDFPNVTSDILTECFPQSQDSFALDLPTISDEIQSTMSTASSLQNSAHQDTCTVTSQLPEVQVQEQQLSLPGNEDSCQNTLSTLQSPQDDSRFPVISNKEIQEIRVSFQQEHEAYDSNMVVSVEKMVYST